jgi:putative endopeptidase
MIKTTNKKNKRMNLKQIRPCRETYTRFEKAYSKSSKYLSKTKKLHRELIDLFKKRSAPEKIRPQDDFYTYINDEWIKKKIITEDQKYIVQIDSYRLTQNKVLKELDQIINDYTKNNKNKVSTQLTNFRKSLHSGFKKADFESHLTSYMTVLEENMKSNTLWKWIAFINKHQMTSTASPFVINLQGDEKNAGIYRFYISNPQVSLIDLSIYDEVNSDKTDKKYKQSVIERYLKYLQDTSDVLSEVNPEYGFNPEHVFEIEQLIIKTTKEYDYHIEATDAYNKFTHDKAMNILDGFDFNLIMREYGCTKMPPFFLTYNSTYIRNMTKHLITNWNTEKWKSYWKYIYAKYLTRAYEKSQLIAFNFYGSFLYGMEQPVDTSVREVVLMSIAFNKFLSTEYYSKYAVPEHLEYTFKFCEDLIEVYKRIIRRNTWLSPNTKTFALRKLEHIKIVIGTAENILEDPPLEYSDTDYWENITKVMFWRTKQKIALEGKPIIDIPELDYTQFPPKFVGKQSYIVNAMYTPSENSIYIPLAYLQKPFIDLDERGIEYNLAHLGFTLCHEMSHALDDLGSLYDHTGNLFDWWTDRDKKIFKQKQKNVIQQYEYVAKLDGIKFDAEPSVGEDLADISGVAICQEYLRDFQDKNDDIPPIRKLSYLAFFVYFAYQQRQQISKKAINAQLHTNPHPLDKYRTNVPLSRLELFRAVWNISKKDKMYWPNMDTIW